MKPIFSIYIVAHKVGTICSYHFWWNDNCDNMVYSWNLKLETVLITLKIQRDWSIKSWENYKRLLHKKRLENIIPTHGKQSTGTWTIFDMNSLRTDQMFYISWWLRPLNIEDNTDKVKEKLYSIFLFISPNLLFFS